MPFPDKQLLFEVAFIVVYAGVVSGVAIALVKWL